MTWVTAPFTRKGVSISAHRFWPPGGRSPVTPASGWQGRRRTIGGYTVDTFPTLADDPLTFASSSIWPNTDDGKPILQLGVNHWKDFTGESSRALRNYAKTYSSNIQGGSFVWTTSLKPASQKIADGEWDPSTGWMTFAAGETITFRTPRFYATEGNASLDTGEWAIVIEISPGSTCSFTTASGTWVSQGSTATTVRRVKTLTASDTGSDTITVTGGISGGQWRWQFIGLTADEATHATNPWTDHIKTYFSGYKVIRFMDWFGTNDSRATKADHMVRAGDHIVQGDAGTWGSELSANDTLRRAGFDHRLICDLMVEIGRSHWINIPIGMGAYVTYADPIASFTGTYSRTQTQSNRNAYAAALDPYFPSIFAAARTEFQTLFTRYVQDLVNSGFPDTTTWYVELSNETWNSSFAQQYNYASAMEKHLFNRPAPKLPRQGQRGGGGTGYLAAMMAAECQAVLNTLKPNQAVKYVVGAQTGTPPGEFCKAVIDGWNLYRTENPYGNALPINRLGIATTGYISHGFKWQRVGAASSWNTQTGSPSENSGNPFAALTEEEFNNAFVAAAGVSEDNLFTIIRDWYIDPTKTKTPSVYGALSDNAAHKTLIESNGAEWIGQYEGSSHENKVTGTNTLTSIYPAWETRRDNWIRSAYNYQVQKLFIDEMYARYPTKIISNYQEVNSSKSGSTVSWQERRPNEMNVPMPNTGAAAWDEKKVSA